MVRCRGDLSRPLESAACSRDTVRLSARKRGPEGTEFAPIRRLRNGTALRTSGEDHAERAAQNRVSSRTVSPRARPPAPLLHHPSRAMRHTQIQQGEYPMKHNTMLIIASLLSILLLTLHITDDIVRGISKAESSNIALLILAVFLYGTLVLPERRWGHVIMLLVGLFAAGMPVIHMRG